MLSHLYSRSMTESLIRPGQRHDLETVVAIYNHYVETSHVTFDSEPWTATNREAWLASFGNAGPHRLLVSELHGKVTGWASSSPLRHRPAYARSVETTVDLQPGTEGERVGSMLYGALLDCLEGVHRAFAAIALPNPASIALHRAHGFREVGRFGEAGFKHGRYWDVAWYQRDW